MAITVWSPIAIAHAFTHMKLNETKMRFAINRAKTS